VDRGSRNPVAILRRDEAPVHQHDGAIGGTQRRQYPVPSAELSDRLHERLRLIKERAGRRNVPIFILRGTHLRPFSLTRCRRRWRVYALLNPCDQIEFPNTAFELPGAKRHERNEEYNRQCARHCQEERRVTTAAPVTTTARVPLAAVSARALTCLATRLRLLVGTARAKRVTSGHRVGVRRRHGMLCMFCIDCGIIL
jgi:hypothetical protein